MKRKSIRNLKQYHLMTKLRRMISPLFAKLAYFSALFMGYAAVMVFNYS